MADPATQFQSAGLQVPYQYVPSHYTPQYVNVPTGAGALWAGVGQTAMEASKMLQNSPALNPQVRAQMKEQITRSHLGIKAMQYAAAHPKWMRATVGEGPGGATQAAPIGYPVAQQTAEGIDWNEDDTGGGGGGGSQQQQQQTITRTGANTGVDQTGNPYHEAKPGSNQWIKGAPPPEPPSNLNVGMAQGGLVQGPRYYATGGSVTDKSDDSSASADHEALLRRMAEERQAVLGAPAGTFLNPATGSYEPMQQQPPAQGSSMWGRPTPIAPPPAPTTAQPQTNQPGNMLLQGSQPPSQTAGAIQQVTQAPGVALADWQNQNAHPVMSSNDALNWAKNYDTGAQRATYLPHGGPNAEPAYAFHMKGGGINTVPISQIVKNGGGPLVAGQNTSAALSASDAISNPPPDQAQVPTPMPSGTGAGAPQGSPGLVAPAAPGPTPMPSGTGAGVPQGSPGPPMAPGAYNPAAYQMPQGPTITQTGDVNPALMAGGTDEQAAAAAKAAGKPGTGTEVPGKETSPEGRATMNADAASKNPNLPWKKDEKGNKYLSLPDPQHPFWEQRFYPLSGGFQTGTWTPENIRKQQLLEEFGGPAGVPLPPDPKTGKKVVLDKDTIDGLSPEEQNKWLNYARDYKLHTKYPLPTSDEGINLANNANAVAAAQRIKDKILYLKANNIPMDAISQDELIRSQEAGWAKSANFPGGLGPWNALAKGGPPNLFADELRSDYKLLNDYLGMVRGGHYPGAKTPRLEEWGTPAIGDWIPPMGIPRGTNVSTIPALNSISTGDNHDQALAHIQEVLDNATTDYKNAAKGLPKGEYRLPDVDQKNLYDLDNKGKGYIDDPTNLIWDKNHQKMVNGYGGIPYLQRGWFDKWTTLGGEQSGGGAGSSPSPSPTPPQITDWDTKQLDKLGVKKNDQFTGPDGKIYTRTK